MAKHVNEMGQTVITPMVEERHVNDILKEYINVSSMDEITEKDEAVEIKINKELERIDFSAELKAALTGGLKKPLNGYNLNKEESDIAFKSTMSKISNKDLGKTIKDSEIIKSMIQTILGAILDESTDMRIIKTISASSELLIPVIIGQLYSFILSSGITLEAIQIAGDFLLVDKEENIDKSKFEEIFSKYDSIDKPIEFFESVCTVIQKFVEKGGNIDVWKIIEMIQNIIDKKSDHSVEEVVETKPQEATKPVEETEEENTGMKGLIAQLAQVISKAKPSEVKPSNVITLDEVRVREEEPIIVEVMNGYVKVTDLRYVTNLTAQMMSDFTLNGGFVLVHERYILQSYYNRKVSSL